MSAARRARRHQQAVRTFLRGITSWDDAEDIAQETFLAVWTHAGSFRGGNVRAWLFSIAWRKAKGAQRTWFRRRHPDLEYHQAAPPAHDADTEDRIAVRQALATLPFAQRAAVVLSLGCGLTHAETADALAIPLGTATSLLTIVAVGVLSGLALRAEDAVYTAASVLLVALVMVTGGLIYLPAFGRLLRGLSTRDIPN